jgi:putative phosphoesterase
MPCVFSRGCYTSWSDLKKPRRLKKLAMIKVGVLSDTHLHGVNEEIRNIYKAYLADTDLLLHAGDIVSEEVLEFLSAKTLYAVCGNMDPRRVRKRLPVKRVLQLGDYRVGLIHGWGAAEDLEERIAPEFSGVDIIVYGHSHRAANHWKDGILFFNPGTATGYSRMNKWSFGILELGSNIHAEIVILGGT